MTSKTSEDPLNYLSKIGLTKEEILEKFEDLQGNSIGFAIVCALQLYDSLNLKNIAVLIGERENTCLHQINKLIENNYIELDAESTVNKRGKYYKLTSISKAIFKFSNEQYKESVVDKKSGNLESKNIDELKLKFAKELKNTKYNDINSTFRMISNINKYIEKISFENIAELKKKLENVDDEKEMINLYKKSISGIGNFSIWSHSFPISNISQLTRLQKILFEINDKLNQLEDEYEQELENNKKDVISNQYLYFFSSPIQKNIFD